MNFQALPARRHAILALLGSTILVTSPAFAQAAAEEASSDEIIVTAQKREENLQNVPISIQALGGEKLAERQVSSFDDYAKLLPSVSFQSYGPGQSQLFFRGISSGGDGLHGGSLPGAGLYIDETPVTTIASSVDIHVYDIARVEALSGPQGTLFGASSLAGTLRIITNKPSADKFEGGVDVQINQFGKGDTGGIFEGFVNVPLTSQIALRVVGFYQRDGGYIDNIPGTRTYTLSDADPLTNITINNAALVEKDFNSVETYGGRAALGINLDDNWTVTPSIIYQHQETKGPFLYDPRAGDLNVVDYLPTMNRDRWYQAALTIQGKLGDWDVVYSGGYFERKTSNQSDYSEYTVAYDALGTYYTNFPSVTGGFIDPTQIQIVGDKYTKQTHEFRVSSPSTNKFRMTAGAFLQRQTDDIEADYIVRGLNQTTFPIVVPPSLDSLFITRASRVDRDYAAFFDASYDFTEKLTLTAGIRGFKARNTFQGFSGFLSNTLNPNCLPTTKPDRPCENFDKTKKESGETHRVTLTYKADSTKLLYATLSTGFRPGGNNRRPGINPYDADTLTNYELGWKTTWLDRRLRINGAVFYEEWNKLQYGLSPIGSAGVTNIYNAGDARVYGAEIDFSMRVGGGLTLSGSGTYIDAKLTSDFCQIGVTGNPDCTLGVVAAPKGARLPVQPKFKGTTTARYEFDMGKFASFVQGSANHQGGTRSYLTTAEANLLGPTKGFTTFDFSIGGALNNWTIEAFIQNAFDKRGQLSINTVCSPLICGAGARVYPIKPQFFGLKAGMRF